MDVEQNQLSPDEDRKLRNRLAQRRYRKRLKELQNVVQPTGRKRGRPKKTDKASNRAGSNRNTGSTPEEQYHLLRSTMGEPGDIVSPSARISYQQVGPSESEVPGDSPAVARATVQTATPSQDEDTQSAAQHGGTFNADETFVNALDPALFESGEPVAGLADPHGNSTATGSPLPTAPASAADPRHDVPPLPPFPDFPPAGELPRAHANIPPAPANGLFTAGSGMHGHISGGMPWNGPRHAQYQLALSPFPASIGGGGMMLVPQTAMCFVPVQMASAPPMSPPYSHW